jgi:4-hydroxy-3-methylbut-2-enyl diphosphate reductase
VDDAAQIDESWLKGVSRIGITAGASAPEVLVKGVIERLQSLGATAPQELVGREETVTFSMPSELRERVIASS